MNIGTESRVRALAREQNRDISEKIALGLSKPSAAMDYDTRLSMRIPVCLIDLCLLHNRLCSPSTDHEVPISRSPNEDEVYDQVTQNSRFEVLGRAQKGFKGAEDADSDGPVQFEKDQDTFGIDAFLGDVKRQIDDDRRKRKMGLNTKDQRDEAKSSKRRRYSDE
jgi:SNW domain-containing protein 1